MALSNGHKSSNTTTFRIVAPYPNYISEVLSEDND